MTVVVARIEVDMRGQLVRCAVECVERARCPHQRGVGVVSAETTIVIRVIADHGGPWSKHRREGRVIRDAGQVHRSLLAVAEVRLRELGAGNEAGISGHWGRDGYARVQRTDEDGLPATAGKSSYRDARRVGVRMSQKDVESALLRKVVQGDAVGSYEIQL